MNHDLFMNDTFDNITFKVSQNTVSAKRKSITDNNLKDKNKTCIQDILFDDTVFLTQNSAEVDKNNEDEIFSEDFSSSFATQVCKIEKVQNEVKNDENVGKASTDISFLEDKFLNTFKAETSIYNKVDSSQNSKINISVEDLFVDTFIADDIIAFSQPKNNILVNKNGSFEKPRVAAELDYKIEEFSENEVAKNYELAIEEINSDDFFSATFKSQIIDDNVNKIEICKSSETRKENNINNSKTMLKCLGTGDYLKTIFCNNKEVKEKHMDIMSDVRNPYDSKNIDTSEKETDTDNMLRSLFCNNVRQKNKEHNSKNIVNCDTKKIKKKDSGIEMDDQNTEDLLSSVLKACDNDPSSSIEHITELSSTMLKRNIKKNTESYDRKSHIISFNKCQDINNVDTKIKNNMINIEENKTEMPLKSISENRLNNIEITSKSKHISTKIDKSKSEANIEIASKSEPILIKPDHSVANKQLIKKSASICESKTLNMPPNINNIAKEPQSKTINIAKETSKEAKDTKPLAIINPEICKLSSWGLPPAVLEKYESRKVTNMFQWQVECLSNPKILNYNANLVYSAPTSAGKTLVSEILAIKTIFERNKKVIFILPFVSIVREKMYYFQDILGSSGIRVEGFMGSYNPPGGFQSVQLAICTIEKANSLINKLLTENKLSEIGAILVDEVHLLGDPSRGYLLELLLTKLRYISLRDKEVNIQIVGMSATLPNLDLLAKWLDAELYTTTFRPIPLVEQAHVCGEIYDTKLKLVRKVRPLPDVGADTDNVLQLCLETIRESCSVLIFCPTKNWCENLSQQISAAFFKIGTSKTEIGDMLRAQIKTELIMELLEQLKYCPIGLDNVLRKTVSFGVAFHHAGLTMDERDIIEGGFRSGALRVLIATSTLSSGVNLPARRVIIRTPKFHGKPIDTLIYRQMIGRAGRMGKDTKGESILICQKNDYNIAKELMSATLQPVESCLEGAGKLKRAILEVVASGVATSPEDVNLFTNCTLLAVEDCSNSNEHLENPIDEAVNFLCNNEFIRLQTQDDGSAKYIATNLGKACLSSSIAPDEGLHLFTELEKARQCFVLETELHLIYLVTPYSACNTWGDIDWMFYLKLWEKLPKSMKRVGELVGIRDSFLLQSSRGKAQENTNKMYQRLRVHKRFFVALALQDLVNEKSLGEVCRKFNCNRGMLQALQQSSSSFAGMVTAFSRQLGWSSVEILISQFQDRMQFGVSRDLLDLMKLPVLNGKMARTLYNAGIETLVQLANSNVMSIENILHVAVPFESEKEREGESEYDLKNRKKVRNVWITGKEGLTEREAAEMLVNDARSYLKIEMGLAEAKWGEKEDKNNNSNQETDVMNENCADKENTNIGKTLVKLSPKTTDDVKRKSYLSMSKIAIPDLNKTRQEEQPSTSKDTAQSTKITSGPKQANEIVEPNDSESSVSIQESSIDEKNLSDSFSNSMDENFKIEDMPDDDPNITKLNNNNVENIKYTEEPNLNDLSQYSFYEADQNIESMNSDDDSMFGFSLQLSDTDEENKPETKTDIPQNAKDLNLDFSNDVLMSSFEEDTASKKRPRNTQCDSSDDMYIGETPSKKKKMTKTRSKIKKISTQLPNKPTEGDRFNESYIQNKLDEEAPVDFSKFELVNVCNNMKLLELFSTELKQQISISISIGCSFVEANRSTIGLAAEQPKVVSEKFSYHNRKVEGIAISWGQGAVYFLSLLEGEFSNEVLKILRTTLKNKHLVLKINDSKEQLKILKRCCDVDVFCLIEDPKVADWIIEPEGREKNLQALAVTYCPEVVPLTQLAGSCRGVGSIALEVNSSLDSKLRSSIEALVTWYIIDSVKEKLSDEDFVSIFEIEMRSALLLTKMEINGMGTSKIRFQQLVDDLKKQADAIEAKCYSTAGRRFNMSSSSDVAKVLGLFRGKKISTRKEVLEKSEHPISNMILQWRKISSTLTKMIYPLIRAANHDRIHGCFITHTATGRITMHEPNLQNITKDFEIVNPVTKEKKLLSCRSAFTAAEGYCIVSADYCQIELRILAHLSQDKVLCRIMKNPGDVFRSIAAKWNKVDESKVDDTMRQNTKQICYGIIYGMGAKTLSEQMNIAEEDAAGFMETFRNTYPEIKVFIQKTIDKCRQQGYVETIIGRRRYLRHINDNDGTLKGQAERQAVNTTVQGSAADIAKKAMVMIEDNLNETFQRSRVKPRLIMHLHDELIYEVPEKYVNKVAKIVKKGMENAIKLSIPFPVKLRSGQSWGELADFKL